MHRDVDCCYLLPPKVTFEPPQWLLIPPLWLMPFIEWAKKQVVVVKPNLKLKLTHTFHT